MAAIKSFYVPLGRIAELLKHDDAHLLAYTMGRGIFDDCKVTRFQSRAALEAFCKKTKMCVLVKNEVPRSMVIHCYETAYR